VSKEYQKLQQDYAAALAKSKGTTPEAKAAFADKARIMGDIRQAERESARAGTVLNPVHRGGRVEVESTPTHSKRSLAEEYVRKFDDKIPVEVENRRTGETFRGTLQEYHARRLLKK
jgi:hypothetical protein